MNCRTARITRIRIGKMEEQNTPQTIIAYAPINIGCKMDNVKFQTIIVDKPQTAVAEEVCELVDTVFFDRKKFGTVESQMRLRNAIKSVLSKLDTDNGRDWIVVYIAYHFFMECELIMKGQSYFFKDIDALMPGLLKKVNHGETSCDKRYKAYSDLLRLECQKWFILNGCLPKVQEWTSSQFRYNVDDTRRRRIQQLVKEVLQGLKA